MQDTRSSSDDERSSPSIQPFKVWRLKLKPVFLKVKIKSLMLEAKVIREEERRAYSNRHARKRARRTNEKLRAPGDRNLYLALRDHRTRVVREEARASQLAYGFLRAVPYRTIEGPTTRKAVPYSRVASMACRFGNLKPEIAAAQINAWLDAGETI